MRVHGEFILHWYVQFCEVGSLFSIGMCNFCEVGSFFSIVCNVHFSFSIIEYLDSLSYLFLFGSCGSLSYVKWAVSFFPLFFLSAVVN